VGVAVVGVAVGAGVGVVVGAGVMAEIKPQERALGVGQFR
jgi:hypothetical protein